MQSTFTNYLFSELECFSVKPHFIGKKPSHRLLYSKFIIRPQRKKTKQHNKTQSHTYFSSSKDLSK